MDIIIENNSADQEQFDFYFNDNGDLVIKKNSIESFIGSIEELRVKDQSFMENFLRKKEYCCSVYFNGKLLDNYQYKEYPILAEAVCIRHTLNRCGTVNGCKGILRKGECERQAP